MDNLAIEAVLAPYEVPSKVAHLSIPYCIVNLPPVSTLIDVDIYFAGLTRFSGVLL